METYTKLYPEVCLEKNIELAWRKARKGKTQKDYVIQFEQNLSENLHLLRIELLLHSYRPQPLETFILRDPKTRKISVSQFRDRIVHHAICNVIEPIFDKKFIYDSYANRKGKGTLAAVSRLIQFLKKVSKNGTIVNKYTQRNIRGFVLKADIKRYFDTVSQDLLLRIIKRTLKDKDLLFLIRNILKNYPAVLERRGMPLGNLTSQFLANVYLNELDQFIKHELRAKYYLRYVDDFVILHQDLSQLKSYLAEISKFLEKELKLELNPGKSKIKPLSRGIDFLGFRVFHYHRFLRARNIKQFYHKYRDLNSRYRERAIDYDTIYNFIEGWLAYAKHANTYLLRQKTLQQFEQDFPGEVSAKEVNRYLKTTFI